MLLCTGRIHFIIYIIRNYCCILLGSTAKLSYHKNYNSTSYHPCLVSLKSSDNDSDMGIKLHSVARPVDTLDHIYNQYSLFSWIYSQSGPVTFLRYKTWIELCYQKQICFSLPVKQWHIVSYQTDFIISNELRPSCCIMFVTWCDVISHRSSSVFTFKESSE